MKTNKFVKFLAVVGAITIIGGIIFAIYKFMKPDYLDEYDDDDYEDDDFDDEDFEIDNDDAVAAETEFATGE